MPPDKLYMKRISSLGKKPLKITDDEWADVIFGGSRRDRYVCQAGWKRTWKASSMTGALGSLRSSCRNNDAASVALDVDGFSNSTCFPALMDLSAHSWWRPLGNGI